MRVPVRVRVRVRVNGVETTVDEGSTVAGLVATLADELGRGGTGAATGQPRVAVARNGEVVPRGDWATTPVHSGDDIEILVPVAGG